MQRRTVSNDHRLPARSIGDEQHLVKLKAFELQQELASEGSRLAGWDVLGSRSPG
jgi:hypothetical protein